MFLQMFEKLLMYVVGPFVNYVIIRNVIKLMALKVLTGVRVRLEYDPHLNCAFLQNKMLINSAFTESTLEKKNKNKTKLQSEKKH